MARPLTKSQLAALHHVAWGQYHFGAFCTGRTTRRSTVVSLIRRGLVESVGEVTICDDDGFIKYPEQIREGFRLTDTGIARAVEDDGFYAKELEKKKATDGEREP